MNKLVIFLKGLLMGACDVVPGVSGGTIAFITGIYERLLDSVNAFDLLAIKLFFTLNWKKLWQKIDGGFLLSLMLGIFVAIISLAKTIQYMLVEHPVIIRSLFLGLLMASIIVIAEHLPKRTKGLIKRAIIGVALGYLGTSLPVTQLEPTQRSTFGAGMIAIMAMILPGISGSYILLMLNHYQHIINNLVSVVDGVKEAIILAASGLRVGAWDHLGTLPREVLGVFILGAILGVLFFVKILHWVKERYHNELIAVLTGIMLGALHKVWPRKETVETFIDRHGEIQPLIENNVLPPTVGSFFIGLLFIGIGIGIIVLIQFLGKKKH